MTTALVPPLKWHGGKHYLARRIVGLMPPHVHYVEPFAGGLSVLLAKTPDGVSEVINDLDGRLMSFWRTLADSAQFEAFRRIVEAVPFSEAAWRDAAGQLDDPDPIASAVAFFLRCRLSLAGRMDTFAPLSRARTRRGMNEQAAAWLSTVDGLPAVHARLRRVVVLSRPALEVIRSQDGPDTLFYLDPPYLPDTRAARSVYRCEMSADDHRDLIATARECVGRVMLSGYPSELYDRELSGWARHDFGLPNHSAGGKAKRRVIESVWCNFAQAEGGPT